MAENDISEGYNRSTKVIIELRALSKEGPEMNKLMLDNVINEMLYKIEQHGKVIFVKYNFVS